MVKASGIGVEKVFPLYSPMIDKVEIVKRAKTRRSKLYYIREKAAKEIRKKMRSLAFSSQEIESEIGEPKNDDKLIDQEEAKIENKEKTLSETENLEVAK